MPCCWPWMVRPGKELWRTPNPHGWKMTHSSIMPMEFQGRRMYVYCANNGVVGVSAKDGSILWETTAWKISIATVPSPLILDGGRIFFTGGYNAGSLMVQLQEENGHCAAKPVFKLEPEAFGATQHTPILYDGHIYGVRADGKFVCLGLDGKVVWTSDAGQQFGLGSFILADGLFFAMNDSGLLRLIEATPDKYVLARSGAGVKGARVMGTAGTGGRAPDRAGPDAHGLPGRGEALTRLKLKNPAIHFEHRAGDIAGHRHWPGSKRLLPLPRALPNRRMGTRICAALRSSPAKAASESVSMKPGHTAFTVMPIRATSLASDCVSPTTPALAAA